MSKSEKKDNYPPAWEDDQRMAVLFAAFRDKSLNPHSWNQKMDFWMTLISDNCKQNNTCMVNIDSLPSHFERKGQYPKCLDLVIQEMQRLNKLKNIRDIQSASSGWMSWGFSVIKKNISWSLGLFARKISNTEKLFYLPEILQEKCVDLLNHHYGSVEHDITDNIVEVTELKDKYQELFPTDLDFDVVLRQLEMDRKIIISKVFDKDTIVKFCKEGDSTVAPIQDCELNVYRILTVEKHLEAHIESLSVRCDSHTKEARLNIREGKKKMALQSLRKRKSIEKIIDKRSNSLDTLHTILLQIQDAVNNEMVVKAYEAGVSALKATSKDFNIDKVENVMDSLQEILEDQEEINQTISQGDVTLGDTTLADLEAELDSMLDENKTSQNVDDLTGLMSNLNTKEPNFPSVPQFSPAAISRGGYSSFVPDTSFL